MKNALHSDDLRTREVVARAILEGGPATAADLAERLKITPAGVRRHLDSLVEEGILEAREPHLRSAASRGRGRPAKVFVMTSGGREQFEHSYDDLALMAIRFMSSQRDGNTSRSDLERNDLARNDAVVTEFARYRASDLERRSLSKSSNAKAKSVRIESLANFLSKDGYAASVHQQGLGHELCQHHCPIAHVAAQYPQLCEAETEAFARILGTHVQRLATIAHGDGVCTTFIPDLDLVNKMDEKKNVKKSLNTVKKEHRGKVAKR